MPSAFYFYGDRLLGSSDQPPFWSARQGRICASHVFVCPECGEAWGRISVPGLEWQALRRACAKHAYANDLGGSFIPSWLEVNLPLDHYPDEVLAHELQLEFRAHALREGVT